ncbi:hypothetical protein QBC44DRAFT_304142 [Cladorrhinum sp. PSN332]|nr:hypothetical protein QBC44DRAFT_304142 [Cladorrhinum sp. PSN332]
MSSAKKLSSPEIITTPIRIPKSKSETQIKDGISGASITVDVCSEFTTYRANIEYLKKTLKVQLFHNKNGLPLVFALTEEFDLILLQHGVESTEGWTSWSITPAGLKVTSFDVIKSGNNLWIAVACKAPEDKFHELYYAQVEIDQAQLLSLNATMEKDQTWVKVLDNAIDPVGNLVITSLQCSSINVNTSSSSPPNPRPRLEIVVGTMAASTRTATFYRVDPKRENSAPWHVMTFPAAASSLRQTSPLLIGPLVRRAPLEQGMVSVFKDHSASDQAVARVIGHVSDPTGGVSRTFEFKTAGKLGDVRSVFSHRNPWGRTDIFMACERGIGFFSGFNTIDQPVDTMAAGAEPILPDISFRQVFCSEAADPSDPSAQTKMIVFAVSDDNSLYYVEAIRRLDKQIPAAFKASGLPIRSGVQQLSTVYSAETGTSELLYAMENESALMYLRREPHGRFWLEDKVFVAGRLVRKFEKYDAYITTLALTAGDDKNGGQRQFEPAAADFPVELTGEFVQVIANGRSVSLRPDKPVRVFTDGSGCVEIVQASRRELACPPITVTLRDDGTSGGKEGSVFAFQVDPSSRVGRLLDGIKGSDDLKAALGDGFSGNGLREAGDFMSQLGAVKDAVKKGDDSDDHVSPSPPSEGGVEGDGILDFLGECIELAKTAVKGLVRTTIKVLGPVVRVVFTYLKRTFTFAIKGLYSLARAVGNFLEDVIGWDGLNRLLDYLKMVFDPASIRATQLFLRGAITGTFDVAARFFQVNKESIKDLFDDGKTLLEQFVDDPRQPSRGKISGLLSDIMNNPVVRLLMKINPMQWIMEAVHEEMPGLVMPPFGLTIDGIFSALEETVEKQVEVMDRMLETFLFEVQKLLVDPSKALESVKHLLQGLVWSLFDGVRNVVEGIYDAITNVMKSLTPVLDGVWKVPGLTDMWMDLTDQEFTLIGAITYLPALILNLASIAACGRLPFEGAQVPKFDEIEIKPLYRSQFKNRETKDESGGKEENAQFMHKSAGLSVQEPPMPVEMSFQAAAFGFGVKGGGNDRILSGGGAPNLVVWTIEYTLEVLSQLGRFTNALMRAISGASKVKELCKKRNRSGGDGKHGGGDPLEKVNPGHRPGQIVPVNQVPVAVDGDGVELITLPPNNPLGNGPNMNIGDGPAPSPPSRLIRFLGWLPNIGRIIAATGNFVLAVYRLSTNDGEGESGAAEIVVMFCSATEIVLTIMALGGIENQVIRFGSELIGRGGTILHLILTGGIVPPIDGIDRSGQVQLLLYGALSGISAELMWLFEDPVCQGFAVGFHLTDGALSIGDIVAAVLRFIRDR